MAVDPIETLPADKDWLPGGPASRLELAMTALGEAVPDRVADLTDVPPSMRRLVRGEWAPVECLVGVLRHRNELLAHIDQMVLGIVSAYSLNGSTTRWPALPNGQVVTASIRRMRRLRICRRLLRRKLASARARTEGLQRELDTLRSEVKA